MRKRHVFLTYKATGSLRLGRKVTAYPHTLKGAEFILETSYPSKRIVCQTDNSSKYKSEDELFEFCSTICLDILSGKQKTLRKYRNQSLSCGNFVKKPSTFRLDINLETDNPSKTNYPSVSTSSRRANRRICLRRILLHNSS